MISTVTTLTAVTTAQVMTYNIIALIALITLLALKEVLSTEAYKNKRIKLFVEGSNTAIVPLLLVFTTVIAYKLVTII